MQGRGGDFVSRAGRDLAHMWPNVGVDWFARRGWVLVHKAWTRICPKGLGLDLVTKAGCRFCHKGWERIGSQGLGGDWFTTTWVRIGLPRLGL